MLYGRVDIVECLEYLMAVSGVPLNGGETANKRYTKLLIDAMLRDYPDHDPIFLIKRLIRVAHNDPRLRYIANDMRYFFYNRGNLIKLGIEQKNTVQRLKEMTQANQGRGYKIVKDA